MTRLTLLGPQRRNPCVADVLAGHGVRGRVAVVTAGWEERESELDELGEHLADGAPDCAAVGLPLFARGEQLFADDPELLVALRRHADERARLQEVYRLRLDHGADAVYALLDRADELEARGDGEAELAREEAADALRAVAALDQRQLRRMREHEARFAEHWSPSARPAWAAAREEIAALLEPCAVLALAGGHVGVLLDRLRLFGIPARIGERRVVAWSAGAMAATERVLLFHDSPPQGRGHAEMYAPGLALAPGLVALPHARRRLLLDDPQRVSVLAARCAPATCVCLDEGGRADWDGKAWTIAPGTHWMTTQGRLDEHAVKGAAK